jgi:FKBP-type peptidyl-prolyl cis-trans isomerase
MKVITLLTVVATLMFASCNNQESEMKEVKITTELDSLSYALGVDMAENFKNAKLENINIDIYSQAMKDVLVDSTAKIDKESASKIINAYLQKKQEEEGKKLSEEGIKFLDANGKKEGIITTASGLQYELLKEGTGVKPTAEDVVKVNYVGTFIDGTEFDSSIKRGQPAEFPLNRVIPGWTEGIQLMSIGSKYRFYIPYNLGYGERGNQGIPPYSTLIFEVELLEINPIPAK